MQYRDYVLSERTMPYAYGFVYDRPATADPGLRPVYYDFTDGTKSSHLQVNYHLFIVLNLHGLLTSGHVDDTYNEKYSWLQISPKIAGNSYLPLF